MHRDYAQTMKFLKDYLLNQDIGVVEKNKTRNLVLCQPNNLVFSQQAFENNMEQYILERLKIGVWCSFIWCMVYGV